MYLAAAEGHVDACALVGHEGGQGLHFVGANVQGVADTSLAGRPCQNFKKLNTIRSQCFEDLDPRLSLMETYPNPTCD